MVANKKIKFSGILSDGSLHGAWTSKLNVIHITFIWYAICSTRNTLRSRYMIPERRCHKCEDICCATLCAPCSIAQMNRHTSDANTFRALCATGMSKHVAVPVNPDAQQVYDYSRPNIVYSGNQQEKV
jgi:Cys-rich protein (TIGR01571 family)